MSEFRVYFDRRLVVVHLDRRVLCYRVEVLFRVFVGRRGPRPCSGAYEDFLARGEGGKVLTCVDACGGKVNDVWVAVFGRYLPRAYFVLPTPLDLVLAVSRLFLGEFVPWGVDRCPVCLSAVRGRVWWDAAELP